jgi:CRP/FNR family cyclic AMP-dependent transcriptional regulator
MNQARLKDVPFFSKLRKKELEMIAKHADEVDVPAGKALTKQGDLGDSFFVIEAGTADVVRDGERINELGPGDFFGEMALLEPVKRTATVTATTPVHFFVLTRQSFQRMLDENPQVERRVLRALAHRALTSHA